MRARFLGAVVGVVVLAGGMAGCSAGPSKEGACDDLRATFSEYQNALSLSLVTDEQQLADNLEQAEVHVADFEAVEVPEGVAAARGEVAGAMASFVKAARSMNQGSLDAAGRELVEASANLETACA